MKKGIIAIIIAAIVAGGAFYFMHRSNSKKAIASTLQSNTTTASSASIATNNTKEETNTQVSNNSVPNTNNETIKKSDNTNTLNNKVNTTNNATTEHNITAKTIQANNQANSSANSNPTSINQSNQLPQNSQTNTTPNSNNVNIAKPNTNTNSNTHQKQNPNSSTQNEKALYQQFTTLGNAAYKLKISAKELRNKAFNAIKDKVPNSGYLMPSTSQEYYIQNGTTGQKASLMKQLGADKLLVNVTFNTNLPYNGSAMVAPQIYDNVNKEFYYGFFATPLSKICESVNNWATYSGYINKDGQLLSVSEYNKLCNEKNIYLLNVQDQTPAFVEANEINIG